MKLSRNRAKCPSHGFCICKNRVQPFQKAEPGFILFMPQGICTLPRYKSRTNGRRTGRSSHTPDTPPDLRRSFCSGADPAAARRKTSRTRCRCIRAWRAATARHAGCSRQNDLPRLVILIRPAPLQSLSAGLRRHSSTSSSSSSKSGSVASSLVSGALFSSACAV